MRVIDRHLHHNARVSRGPLCLAIREALCELPMHGGREFSEKLNPWAFGGRLIRMAAQVERLDFYEIVCRRALNYRMLEIFAT